MIKLSKLISALKHGRQPRMILFLAIAGLVLKMVLPAQAGLPTIIRPQYVQELAQFLDIQIPGWQRDGEPTGVTMKEDDAVITSIDVKFHSGDNIIKRITIQIEDNGEKVSDRMLKIAEAKCSREYITKIQFKGFPALQLSPSELSQYGLNSELFINVADKLLVTFKGNEFVDLDTLKTVANQIDLNKLAKLKN